MMWYWGSGVHWWGWLLMSLGMVAFWGLVIWAVWFVVTSLTHSSQSARRSGEAKRILDERLARGEIDAEEYRRLRDLLRDDEARPGDRQTPVGTGRT
jgi:putative membrane protein